MFREALDLQRQLMANMPPGMQLELEGKATAITCNLASALHGVGDVDGALKLLEEEIASAKPLSLALRQLELSLGGLYCGQGEYEKACPLMVRSLERLREELGRDPSSSLAEQTLVSMASLANCYSSLGEDAVAIALSTETYTTALRVFGEAHPDTQVGPTCLARSSIFCYTKQSGCETTAHTRSNVPWVS